MENNTIQITPTIIGFIVPIDAHEFIFINNKTRIGYKIDDRLFKLELPKGEFKIHGTCTLPELEFDFEFNGFFHRIQLRLDIQKAIYDAGLLPINPIDIKGQTFSNEHQNKWQESESKVIRGKLLIIEKNYNYEQIYK